MRGFTVHNLRFVAEAAGPISLGEHKGSALRGALVDALRRYGCSTQGACPPGSACPVCAVVFPTDETSRWGRDVPRPYVILPPLDHHRSYVPGDSFSFGIRLFASAAAFIPFAILAVRRMGEEGLGRSRGRFRLREVWEVDPIGGVERRIWREGETLVRPAGVAVDAEAVAAAAAGLPGDRLRLRLLTPLRVIEDGALVRAPAFGPLMQRLLERLIALARDYGEGPPEVDVGGLRRQAETVEVRPNGARWEELERYSSRQGRRLPMGGLLGELELVGDLGPFVPWLVWGQVTHVGKYAVMGNGWIEVGAVRDEGSQGGVKGLGEGGATSGRELQGELR